METDVAWWMWLLSGGGAIGLVGLARQIRLMIRDIGDRRLARYVFEQTRRIEPVEMILERDRPKQLIPGTDDEAPRA
ncbi:hypothetical protein [Kribbella sindirgiensis]|uniref:Uncharacterized protein n=1 Tax=Kribbella sindirgiensis TaxID=1124744 RepID=A0A4R0I285_9ACTN|nr:hypothetical protein [Kribbella sindirgiensis]TCC19986.1 hypothetical protein E0H50_37830 [Kribbella sindirgiensis]